MGKYIALEPKIKDKINVTIRQKNIGGAKGAMDEHPRMELSFVAKYKDIFQYLKSAYSKYFYMEMDELEKLFRDYEIEIEAIVHFRWDEYIVEYYGGGNSCLRRLYIVEYQYPKGVDLYEACEKGYYDALEYLVTPCSLLLYLANCPSFHEDYKCHARYACQWPLEGESISSCDGKEDFPF